MGNHRGETLSPLWLAVSAIALLAGCGSNSQGLAPSPVASPSFDQTPSAQPATPTGSLIFQEPIWQWTMQIPDTWYTVQSGDFAVRYFTTSSAQSVAGLGPTDMWLTITRVNHTQPSCIQPNANPTSTQPLVIGGVAATRYYFAGPIQGQPGTDSVYLGVASSKSCYTFSATYMYRVTTADTTLLDAILTSFRFGPRDA